MASRVVRSTRPGRKIDFKNWDAIPGLVQELSTPQTFQGGALNFAIPATILRMRGGVQASFDESVQAGDRATLAFGLAVVSTDAFSAGAVPDPASEPEYPWLWWGVIELECTIVTANWTAFPWGSGAMRLPVDSKAMRKIKPGESLTWVAQAAVMTGSPTVIAKFEQTRTLIGT